MTRADGRLLPSLDPHHSLPVTGLIKLLPNAFRPLLWKIRCFSMLSSASCGNYWHNCFSLSNEKCLMPYALIISILPQQIETFKNVSMPHWFHLPPVPATVTRFYRTVSHLQLTKVSLQHPFYFMNFCKPSQLNNNLSGALTFKCGICKFPRSLHPSLSSPTQDFSMSAPLTFGRRDHSL